MVGSASSIRLAGHQSAISSDGRWIVTGTAFDHKWGEVRVFSSQDGSLRHEWESGPNRVVDFSSDGRLVLAGGWDGQVQVWDVERGDLVHRWEIDGPWLTSVGDSPDGKFLVASSTKEARVWNRDSGRLRFKLTGHNNWITTCLISPDSHWLVTAGHDGTARIYDLAKGDLNLVLRHGSRIDAAAITPDGLKVVTMGSCTIQIWDPASGKRERSIDLDRVSTIALSSDSRTLFAGTGGSAALAFDLHTGERTASFGFRPFASRVHLSPEGEVLGVGFAGFALFDPTSRSQILAVPSRRYPGKDLEFSPDGRFLLSTVWSKVWPKPPPETPQYHKSWAETFHLSCSRAKA